MKSLFLLLLSAVALAIPDTDPNLDSSTDYTDTAQVYIQSLPHAPIPLASIGYNPSTLSGLLLSYEPPVLTPTVQTATVGLYDASAGVWKSATSTTSAESFAKGFRPTLVLSLDAQGAVLGVSVKAAVIDAGQTREFGPRVVVRGVARGKGPVLNRPVVLNPEGKVDVPEPEKTMLQKYWWVLLGGIMILMTTGGGE